MHRSKSCPQCCGVGGSCISHIQILHHQPRSGTIPTPANRLRHLQGTRIIKFPETCGFCFEHRQTSRIVHLHKELLALSFYSISLVDTAAANRTRFFDTKRKACRSRNLRRDMCPGEHLRQSYWRSCPLSHPRARWTAARVCPGAVPPIWLRLLIDPSRVKAEKTSLSINGENFCNSGKVSALRSRWASAAKRTACATASCASRKGVPFRTR